MPKPRTRKELDEYAALPAFPEGFFDKWGEKVMAEAYYSPAMPTKNGFAILLMNMFTEYFEANK